MLIPQSLLVAAALLMSNCAFVLSSVDDWSKVQDLNVDSLLHINTELSKEERITNGELAVPKQFPYQAGLLLQLEKGRAWCGGTLISNRWVLTAAHCAVGVASVDVYLGTTNRTDATERGQQIIFVSKKNLYVHEEYDASTITNDIALIKLPVVLEFNEFVQPAKLPKISEPAASYVGERAIASGWGLISDAASAVTDVLRFIEVPILENRVCNSYYLGSVKDTNICTSSKGDKKSTCNGDSGGPLVLVDNESNDILIGATSFGIIFGCEVGFPAAFTRITSYLDWIKKVSGVVYH